MHTRRECYKHHANRNFCSFVFLQWLACVVYTGQQVRSRAAVISAADMETEVTSMFASELLIASK